MAEELKPNMRIVVMQKQLHSKNYDIIPGELVSVQGTHAVVELENEGILRSVPIAAISAADALLGNLTDRANEESIVDLTRRR